MKTLRVVFVVAIALGSAVGLSSLPMEALATGPAHDLAAAAPRSHASGRHVVGDLIYVTNQNAVHLVTVHSNGNTSTSRRIGPVTAATSGHSIQVQELVGSGDGKWAAWREASVRHTSAGEVSKHATVVLRNQVNGRLTTLPGTSQYLLGFARDTLVTVKEGVHNRISRVKLSPQPHYETMRESEAASPLCTYRHGVVESYLPHSSSADLHEQLRLTSFQGRHHVLHTYVVSPGSTRTLDLGFTSGDQRRLAVELGDHTDFGGVGPSSLVDEYSLGGSHHVTHLGHYGTASAGWRVQSTTFAGQHDSVWTAWTSADQSPKVRAVVARYDGGQWKQVRNHAVAVTGSESGWLVAQPGMYVPIKNDVAPQYRTKATSAALLVRPGHGQQPLAGVKGTAFAWARH